MKTRLLLLLLILTGYAQAQVTNRIQGDSIRINQTGNAPAELILENSTKNRAGGVLKNRGNGRTEFDYVIDSAWTTGDTLYLKRGPLTMKIRKGGLGAQDTTAKNGLPAIVSGWWARQQLDSLGKKSDAKYLTSAQDYFEDGVKVGIKFTTDSVDYVIRFSSTGQPNYLRRIFAGYGEINVNDSTNAVDTSVIATRARLTQQVNILEAAKLNVNPAISGGTYLKITYDSKGLVTGGANATTSDVAEGSNLYYTAARARGALSLNFTTTGTSGPASGGYDPATGLLSINVPQYQAGSSFGNQLANMIFGGPLSGASASPSFRAFQAEYDLSPTGKLYFDPSNRATLKAIGNTTDTVVNFYRGDSLVSGLTSSGAWFNKFYVNGVLQNYYRYANSGNQIALQFYNKAFESRSEIKYLGDAGGYEFRTITGPGTPITRFAIFGSGESVFYNTTTVPKLRFTAVTSKSNIGTGDQVYHGIDNKFYGGVGSEVHQFITADASNTTFFPGNIVAGSSNPPAAKLYVDGTGYFNATSSSTYGLIASGSTGTGTRAIFIAGKEGVTNGFSVDWNGSAMRYLFRDGKIGVGHLDPGSSIQVVGGIRGDSLIGNQLTTGQVVVVGQGKELINGGTLSTVATSGNYNDLSNKPTIPAAQVQSNWTATSGMGVILNKPTLATVATSGSYTDLSNKPTIPGDNQTLSLVGSTLTISGSNSSVNLPTASGALLTNNFTAAAGGTAAAFTRTVVAGNAGSIDATVVIQSNDATQAGFYKFTVNYLRNSAGTWVNSAISNVQSPSGGLASHSFTLTTSGNTLTVNITGVGQPAVGGKATYYVTELTTLQ